MYGWTDGRLDSSFYNFTRTRVYVYILKNSCPAVHRLTFVYQE